MMMMKKNRQADLRVGTAAWSIPRAEAESFPGEGTHLERYARVMNCCEINSSFYRSHRVETYVRWAEQTPPGFRFSVKLPRSITHDARLRRARAPLRQFLGEVAGLGDRLGPLLVQLPPSFAFEARSVRSFFDVLAEEHAGGAVVLEARHASWFTAVADRALVAAQVSRVAADPARYAAAAEPGGWLGPDGDGRGALLYYRWHGSPHMYWSAYGADWLAARAEEQQTRWHADAERWCIFDNTAAGHALTNALQFRARLSP